MTTLFTLRKSGNIGQEIISPGGRILAWPTDQMFGAFMCRILNDGCSDDDPLAEIFGETCSTNNETKGSTT